MIFGSVGNLRSFKEEKTFSKLQNYFGTFHTGEIQESEIQHQNQIAILPKKVKTYFHNIWIPPK